MKNYEKYLCFSRKVDGIELEIVKNIYNTRELFKKRELLKKESDVVAYSGKTIEELKEIRNATIDKMISLITDKTIDEFYTETKKYGTKKARIEESLEKEADSIIVNILKHLLPYESDKTIEGAELIADIDLYFVDDVYDAFGLYKEEEILCSEIRKIDMFQIYKSNGKYLLVGHIDDNYFVCEYDNIYRLRYSIECNYIDFNNDKLKKEFEKLYIENALKNAEYADFDL